MFMLRGNHSFRRAQINKQILQIAPSMTVKGGISSFLKMYLKADLLKRYDLNFLATHEDGTKLHKFVIMLIGIFKFFYILLLKRIDIVHFHCGDIPSPCRKYIFYKISQCFKHRAVLHLHGALFLEQYKELSGFWKKRLRTFFEGADVVICLSQSWSDAIGRLYPNSKRIVVPNGILLPDRATINLKKTNEPIHIVFLGLIGPRKGVFDLLEVFDRLVGDGYDIRLSIGGNGDIERLRTCISLPHLKDRVHYLGWIDETQKARLLAGSDIFALPSYGEGMPMAILEAMAYGLAVLSTSVGGIPELVDDGETGYLVGPGDLEALYNRLKTLVGQQELRMKMGRSGRRKVEDGYDIKKNHQAISRVYDRLKSNRSELCENHSE